MRVERAAVALVSRRRGLARVVAAGRSVLREPEQELALLGSGRSVLQEQEDPAQNWEGPIFSSGLHISSTGVQGVSSAR